MNDYISDTQSTTKQKVFCIGFHKTGTTTIAQALTILGYRVTGPNGIYDPNIENNVYGMAHRLVQQYDAFQDNPWPILYEVMDRSYPGSKFIFTWRSPESWIESQVSHFGEEVTPMRKWIYGVGCPKGNEKIYLRKYENHYKDVLAYFKNRPDDLLVLNLTKGEGWEKLCPFLGEQVLQIPFPHLNKAEDRQN